MLHLVLVGVGGFAGSVGRYAVALGVQRWTSLASAPWATLAVNVVGCFAIGVVAGAFEARPGGLSDTTRLLVVVGFLGGFTTFSAFGLDTLELMREGAVGGALLNVLVQVIGGLAAVWVGLELAKRFV